MTAILSAITAIIEFLLQVIPEILKLIGIVKGNPTQVKLGAVKAAQDAARAHIAASKQQ